MRSRGGVSTWRSWLPRIVGSASDIKRSAVSTGHSGPLRMSPRLTVTSAPTRATSSSTASSAGRLPWMSEKMAMRSAMAASAGTAHAIGTLDLGDAQLEMCVPLLVAQALRLAVLGVGLPRGDVLGRVEIGDGDAEAVGPARALDAEEARLLARQLDHALGHRAVAGVALGALAAEDHRVIRRLGRRGEACGAHRVGPSVGPSILATPGYSAAG